MGRSPLPPFPTGLGEAFGPIGMLLVVGTRHIDTILLHVVVVITETIHRLLADLKSCLYQLVILVVTHG